MRMRMRMRMTKIKIILGFKTQAMKCEASPAASQRQFDSRSEVFLTPSAFGSKVFLTPSAFGSKGSMRKQAEAIQAMLLVRNFYISDFPTRWGQNANSET